MNVSIEKVEIVSFGKLKNVVITASKGINILSAPNESGKSTLAAFIKFVFYGFAGGRTKSLRENERKLYTPWDSEVSEGSIHILADGVRYTVHRRCLPSGKEVCEIINRATGKPEFSGSVAGEVFFGVNESVFARSLFFKQLTLPQSEDGVIAERLRNIAISADEEVGTQKALKRLNDCKNELKGKMGNGIIPALIRERDAVEESLSVSEALRKESQALRESIKMREKRLLEAEKKLSELNSEKENIDKYDALLRLKNLKMLSEEEKSAYAEYAEIASGLKQHPDSSVFGALTAKNGELIAEQRNFESLSEGLKSSKKRLSEIKAETADIASLQATKKSYFASKKRAKLMLYLALVLLVSGIGLLFVNKWLGVSFVGLGVAASLAAVIFSVSTKGVLSKSGIEDISHLNMALENGRTAEMQSAELEKSIDGQEKALKLSKDRLDRLKQELDFEIEKYSDVDEPDNNRRIEYILSLSAEIGEVKALWQAKKAALENALSGIDPEALAQQARGAYPPERDKSTVEKELRFYGSQQKQLSELNRQNELECTALEAKSGDPAVLKGKLESLNLRIAELDLKYKAYEKAMQLINESADYMKSMVMPMLEKSADEYFSLATGGKYKSLEIDTRLSMTFGEDFRRSCDYLSAGTRDSAYLSLRLALADMLFGGCGVPMILDDAFVRIDDMRLQEMSKALLKAAEKHQLFIFTHSNREEKALDAVGGEYTKIEIKTV